jgi:hypothetical protein
LVLRKLVAAALAATLLGGGSSVALAKPKAAITAAAPESAGFSAEGLKKLDAHMQGLVDTGHLPGVTTMLVRHGKVVNYEVHGKKGFEGPPMTRNTVFRIYSQTKPVTGVAMMILYEEGRWKLDDPVSKYIPEFASLRVFKGVNADGSFDTVPADRPPTMRELMSHSGGFAYGLNPDNPIDKAYVDTGVLGAKSSQEFVQKIAALPLVAQPGTRWKYSVSVDIRAAEDDRHRLLAAGREEQSPGLALRLGAEGPEAGPGRGLHGAGHLQATCVGLGRRRPGVDQCRLRPLRPDVAERRRTGGQAHPEAGNRQADADQHAQRRDHEFRCSAVQHSAGQGLWPGLRRGAG